ncbi:flagellar hook-length control protein FliK [Nitrosococcus watsonii]|uniref:Flagellar hook-length control protein n=1 Tax=Nitrosococcus watsoni (strain C-113) TaxID=105559 RepID=D8K8B2_NITWC|nr:flagellar hook-length control protein FliK [Nitrosococcus watsonii]ADJ29032.1 flagellar hook-length control protein [Nitrosococcus watsonii C-113]
MTTPDFWVMPLASSSSASVGKPGVNSGDFLAVESEGAVSVKFPVQLEEMVSEINPLPEQPPFFAGLAEKIAAAGDETNLSTELLSLEQAAGEQGSPEFGLSLPESAISMAADFGHFPMVEAFESNPGSADLPEVIVSDSQSAAQSSLLITRDTDRTLSGISPDSSKLVNSAINLVLSGQPQNLINQKATNTPGIPTLTGAVLGPVVKNPGGSAGLPAPLSQRGLEASKEGALPVPLQGRKLGAENSLTPEVPTLTGTVLGPVVKNPGGSAGLPAPPSQLGLEASKEGALPVPLQGKESGTENSLPIGEDFKLSSGLDVTTAEMDSQLFLGHRDSSTSLRGGLQATVATEAPALVQGDSQVLMVPAPLRDRPSLVVSPAPLNSGFTGAAISNLSASSDNAMGLTLESAIQESGWGEELGERMTWLVKDKLQFAELRLTPPQLGPLEARINMHHDEASITFHAPQAAVREALEAALPRLRESFAEQGLNLVNVDVSQQGFSEQQQQAAQSKNLQATLAEESPETAASEDSAGGIRLFSQQGGVDYYA